MVVNHIVEQITNKQELIEKLAITNKLTKDILKPLFEGKITKFD